MTTPTTLPSASASSASPSTTLAAIEAASAEVQGTVTGVDLSEDNGTAIWEVSFGEDTADEITVEVDAETGDVLRTEQDD